MPVNKACRAKATFAYKRQLFSAKRVLTLLSFPLFDPLLCWYFSHSVFSTLDLLWHTFWL